MSIAEILERLELPKSDALDLLKFSRVDEASRQDWRGDPRLYRAFSKKLIQAGHPTRAFELVREGLEAHPRDEDLDYLGALSLRRGGNIQQAAVYTNKLLARVDIRPSTRLEALSLAGSIEKEKYIRSTRSRPDPGAALRSADLYTKAYALAQDPTQIPSRKAGLFPGINAATMAFLADDVPRARTLAGEVLELAGEEIGQPQNQPDYWLLATIGEAMLLSGDLPGAASAYNQAVDLAISLGQDGEVSSMRRNFQLLRAKIPLNEEVWGFFNIGNVVAFAGHMIDHPTRTSTPSRFPDDPRLIHQVEQAIDRELESLNARVGYCSVASGSDILFAERMIARKAELHVILPFELEDFHRISVDHDSSTADAKGSWRARCDTVLETASQLPNQVHYATTERHLGDDVLFTFANTFIQGLAIIRAAERGVDPFALVVLDRQKGSAGAPGGTADFLDKWTARKLQSRIIDLKRLRQETGAVAVRPSKISTATPTDSRVRRKTRVMLFADVKNFSKLDDVRYPDFFSTFLDEVKQVIDATNPPPVFVNTWGDGLYVVFERVVDGADFALRLVDRVKGVKWAELGLPADTTVRIGIHAGPVYQRMDPIIGRENVFGSQVNRAARIEPVTTPGCVFASEQFAAALAVEANHPFHCEYVGIEKLHKGYDRCKLYLLGRQDPEMIKPRPSIEGRGSQTGRFPWWPQQRERIRRWIRASGQR